jgi:N-acetylglucosamine-6-sulfatase
MRRHLSSRWTRKTTAATVALAMAASSCAVAASASDEVATRAAASGSAPAAHAPDIVLILTDDQRFDTLWAMPTVQSELVAKGVEFTKGYISNPVCCPSRSSILTGLYSHSTGVYTNHPSQPYGGFPAFHDGSTVSTWLHDDGYRTALIGKYLNGYTGSYVPPGWDRWFVTWDGHGYYDYSANTNGKVTGFGSASKDYSTAVLAHRATDFIMSTKETQPLFLYFAPHAPHAPATPAPRDAHAVSDLGPGRPPNYNEADVSDKPAYIRAERTLSGSAAASVDRFRQDQLRTLLSTDRAVASILDALTVTGRLSNTLIVFMSDNGMLWGEHRWQNKLVPYEESVRVPFVVRYDALIPAPRIDRHLVVNIDLAPTFAQLAGVNTPAVEGRSLLPLLTSSQGSWRTDFLMEHVRMDPGGVPTYCGVHSERYVYVDYVTGEEELYDLARDPFELQNEARSAEYVDVLLAMRNRLKQLCRPRPPGFRFTF